jgi:hypothetical protein
MQLSQAGSLVGAVHVFLRDITSEDARMSGGEGQLGKSLYNNAFTSHPLCSRQPPGSQTASTYSQNKIK